MQYLVKYTIHKMPTITWRLENNKTTRQCRHPRHPGQWTHLGSHSWTASRYQIQNSEYHSNVQFVNIQCTQVSFSLFQITQSIFFLLYQDINKVFNVHINKSCWSFKNHSMLHFQKSNANCDLCITKTGKFTTIKSYIKTKYSQHTIFWIIASVLPCPSHKCDPRVYCDHERVSVECLNETASTTRFLGHPPFRVM